jgi:hypothetical protein
MGVGGQRHAPAALPPEKTRYPLYRILSGPQRRSGHARKISPLSGFDPRIVQPVAIRYTDCAKPAHKEIFNVRNLVKHIFLFICDFNSAVSIVFSKKCNDIIMLQS